VPEPHDVRALAGLLGEVQRRLDAAEREELATLGLTPPVYRLLDHLVERGAEEPAVAARALGVSQPSVSGWVATLAGLGLIERGRHRGDGRRALLAPTAAGEALHARATDRIRRRLLRLLAPVDPVAQAELLDALVLLARAPAS
jgi:DNA-binding MarR family transcriptional regulator